MNEASAGGVHGGHIQFTHYSSKGQDKIIYTFRIPIWRPSWISHFTQAIHNITLQIYFGYHLICISASSVPINYLYLLQLFFGNFFKYVFGFFEIDGISRRLFLLGSCLEILFRNQ